MADKKTTSEPIMSLKQQAKIQEALDRIDPAYGLALRIILETGMDKTQVCALLIRNIDRSGFVTYERRNSDKQNSALLSKATMSLVASASQGRAASAPLLILKSGFPVSRQSLNRALSHVGSIYGKNLSYTCLRQTWLRNCYLSGSMSVEEILQICRFHSKAEFLSYIAVPQETDELSVLRIREHFDETEKEITDILAGIRPILERGAEVNRHEAERICHFVDTLDSAIEQYYHLTKP